MNTFEKGNTENVNFEELMTGLKQDLKKTFQLKEKTTSIKK